VSGCVPTVSETRDAPHGLDAFPSVDEKRRNGSGFPVEGQQRRSQEPKRAGGSTCANGAASVIGKDEFVRPSLLVVGRSARKRGEVCTQCTNHQVGHRDGAIAGTRLARCDVRRPTRQQNKLRIDGQNARIEVHLVARQPQELP
jgi:hypothetical protein